MRYFNENFGATEVRLHVDEKHDDERVRAISEQCSRNNELRKLDTSLCLVLASAVVLVVIGWIVAKNVPGIVLDYETMEYKAVFNTKLFGAYLFGAVAEVIGYFVYCFHEFSRWF